MQATAYSYEWSETKWVVNQSSPNFLQVKHSIPTNQTVTKVPYLGTSSARNAPRSHALHQVAMLTIAVRMALAKYVSVQPSNRPEWLQPTREPPNRLRVRNSLTDRLEEFVPHEGNRVRWYTCKLTLV
jgi:hypothetical protein